MSVCRLKRTTLLRKAIMISQPAHLFDSTEIIQVFVIRFLKNDYGHGKEK